MAWPVPTASSGGRGSAGLCTAALVMLAEVQWGFGERGPGGEGGGPLLRAVVQASTGLQPVLVGSKAA